MLDNKLLHKYRYLPQGLLVLLLSLIILVLSHFMHTLYQHAEPLPVPTTISPALPSHNPAAADLHLFGLYKETMNRDALLPQAMTNLTLQGIYAAVPLAKSQAVIAVVGHKEKVYSVGDTLPGGGKIAKILSNAVIIERQGRYEALRFETHKLNFNAKVKPLFNPKSE